MNRIYAYIKLGFDKVSLLESFSLSFFLYIGICLYSFILLKELFLLLIYIILCLSLFKDLFCLFVND